MEKIENQTSNMDIYNSVRNVPDSAVKAIEAGRLKGKSDINPMWRIKKLTETFGPAGFGWYTEIVSRWEVPCDNGELAVFVEINLFVKRGGEWSRPIHGTGGNKVICLEKKWNGGEQVTVPYLDDDSYKKAYTDAISVAAKALGIGADVYWEADKGKYSENPAESVPVPAQKAPAAPSRQGGRTVLSPEKTIMWTQAVAYTARLTDSRMILEDRIRSKYDITEEDLQKLMHQAGKDE